MVVSAKDELELVRQRDEARHHRSIMVLRWLLLGFAVLCGLTSLFFGHMGEPWFQQTVYYRGSNVAGPLLVREGDELVHINAHGGLVADNTWATVRCEIRDESGEASLAFHDVIWHEEGWDDEGSWIEWDVGIDLDAVLPPGSYSLAFFIEEAPGTAPREGRLDEGDIRVEVTSINGSPVPHRMAGGLALILAAGLLLGGGWLVGPRRRWLERVAAVALAALYVGLFVMAMEGWGYAGYRGRAPSWWDFSAPPTEHGPAAARDQYPKNLDTLRDEDGGVYAGVVEGGQAHGTGRSVDALGTRIFGQFRHGKPNGKVIVEYHQRHRFSRYEGTMKDGELDGQGDLWLRNNDHYVGEFAHGAKHGQGTYAFADGRTQAGRWRDDEYLGP